MTKIVRHGKYEGVEAGRWAKLLGVDSYPVDWHTGPWFKKMVVRGTFWIKHVAILVLSLAAFVIAMAFAQHACDTLRAC